MSSRRPVLRSTVLRRAALAALAVGLAPACPECAPPVDAVVVPLGDVERASRVSIALRGVRPSAAELEAVEADPAALDGLVDTWMATPEFAATIREMHAEQWLLGVDPIIYPAGFPAVGALAGRETQEMNQSVIDAPLKLVEHVVMNDRPYHEIVTADYVLANDVTSTIFGIPYDAAGEEWQVTQYDDREHAGVLVDGYIFTRFASTPSNMNRGRAAFAANALLCYDFLSRQVELDTEVDLSDDAAVRDAVQNNPKCQSCHQTLDPLAAHFADHYFLLVPAFLTDYPFEFMNNPLAIIMRAAEPGYFGTPTRGLRDLGILMAGDPRFSTCTARRFSAWFLQEEKDDVPVELVAEMNDVFLANGMNAKALVKAVVLSDAFAAGAAGTLADDDEAEQIRGVKTAGPEQIARMVEGLTGYRWRTTFPVDFLGTGIIGDVDLMEDALFGFATLAGGTDSQSVPRPAGTTSATSVLVLEQLAAHAAPYVVEQDFAVARDQRRLLREIDADTVDEGAVRAQLARLHLLMFGQRVDAGSPDVGDLWTLWSSVSAQSGARRAWEITIYGMLRDVRLLSY